jgi:hypothetical protein
VRLTGGKGSGRHSCAFKTALMTSRAGERVSGSSQVGRQSGHFASGGIISFCCRLFMAKVIDLQGGPLADDVAAG